jgi:saccharopine dehydrogenase-like NADP-dependent oxidoreductase
MNRKNILIAGAGGIGRSVALILAEWSKEEYTIFIGDANQATLNETLLWLEKSKSTNREVFQGFEIPYTGESDELIAVLQKGDIILDCLPGSLAPRIAKYALDYDLHYANLTEYVKETEQIVEIAKQSNRGFVLQTGLAPGFVNVLANQLYQEFCEEHQVTKVERILMSVGALTQTATPPHYYGFTWSPIGVATEYLENTKVLRDYELTYKSALSERESLYIDGKKYEIDITSGGAADLPEFFKGKAKRLDYKTIRYEGHYDWIANQIKKMKEANVVSPDNLQTIMEENIPRVEDDMVVIFSSVVGKDKSGNLYGKEKYYTIYPTKVGNAKLRAIQVTTASPLAQIAENLLAGKIKGAYFQSEINTRDFFNGTFVSRMIHDNEHKR